MRIINRFYRTGILSLTLISPLVLAPSVLPADDDHRQETRRYHDAKHRDDHEWNNHEDQAYRLWAKERHRKYREFSRLTERERDSYWNWRHEHSDAQLKIELR